MRIPGTAPRTAEGMLHDVTHGDLSGPVGISISLPKYDLYRLEMLMEELNNGRFDSKPYRPKVTRNATVLECIRLGMVQLGVVDVRPDATVPVYMKKVVKKAQAAMPPPEYVERRAKSDRMLEEAYRKGRGEGSMTEAEAEEWEATRREEIVMPYAAKVATVKAVTVTRPIVRAVPEAVDPEPAMVELECLDGGCEGVIAVPGDACDGAELECPMCMMVVRVYRDAEIGLGLEQAE